MKRIEYTKYIVIAFVAVLLTGLLSSCFPEQRPVSRHNPNTDGRLFVNSIVSDAVVVTRAPSDVEKKEKQLNTLDVFVQRTSDGKFIGQYHLPYPDGQAVQEQVNNFLADYWRDEGLEVGKTYNIYIATNNPKSSAVADLASFNPASLVYDEVSAGVAVLDGDNNIGWVNDTTSGNIFKLYDANPGTSRALTSHKEFMMDGVLKNWTPNTSRQDQVFEVTLNRAAAKFVLNVKFDKTFLKTLTHNMKVNSPGDTTWTEKPDAEKVYITGTPAWKFYNFAFGAPVFAPETQGAGVEVHNSGFNIFHNQTCADGQPFQIVTYSYPNAWAKTDYATKAPSLVVSIGYTQGTGTDAVTNYHYYRIPLVKNTVTAIERNHIYVVNATIATRGSAAQEDQDVTEDIQYAVLPWNDQSNSEVIENHVESIQHYYFNVNPKVYTLRGDGDQSVVLNYSKASGTKVNWKLFTYDEDGNQTGVVANNDEDAIRAWFYNANGAFTTTYDDNESGMNWSNSGPTPMGVTIEQSTEGTSGSKGTVTVTSHALNNRAIKYIRLRVYLDEEATFQDGVETMYEDIIIRHFPTDNVQNIVGSWSSYVPASGGTQTVTLTTTSLAEAEEWAALYGVSYTTSEVSATDYISYAEYTAHAGEEGYAMSGPTAINQSAFQTAIPSEQNRQVANGQANAIADAGEGHSYYWGTSPTSVATNIKQRDLWWYDYDYTVPNGNRYDLYEYSNYYYATYTHSYTQTQYTLTVEVPTTGNWVDWDRDANQTYSGNDRKINANSNFFAKVYSNGYVNAVVVNQNGNAKTYTLKRGANTDYYYYWNGTSTQYMRTSFNLTNNHMYVIQISSTSDEYVLGRPYVNTSTNLSNDDVVSPAFMIASQLGAVTPFENAASAATHCRRYLEVAADGTRYTGWRLPTPDEISVITRYQQGTINGVTISNANYQAMTPVLTGNTYWSLTGNPVSTGIGTGGPYLRCVRDLSAEEVERLNGFEAIQEKYR